MKLGFAEIGVIVVIALIIFGIVRMRQIGKNTTEKDKTPTIGYLRERTRKVSKQTRYPRIQILGIIFILVAILILLSNIRLAKWVGEAPIWAIAIAAIGLVVIFFARRR